MDTSIPKPRIPSALRDDVGNVKDDIRRIGEHVTDAASTGVKQVRETVSEYADTALQQGKKALNTVEDRIVDNPLAAVGIALGVGFLIGALVIGARR